MQLTEKRDAAILEKHKEGMSNNAIAKLFDMNPMTVGRILADQEACNKMRNPQNVTPESSTSAVPMASTEDRSDTREDARSFIDAQLDALLTN
ncbi:helix-turn-helix domain-containing protein [Aeromonas caviae]|nr:helix-turn-helix domain-containing protein [Aeromonas caviae]